jgi:hypothetical protein
MQPTSRIGTARIGYWAAQRKSSRLSHVGRWRIQRELVEWWDAEQGITIEIVGKLKGQTTFVVAPRRWVVERTLANLGRARRLAKDYERDELYSEAQVYLASIGSLPLSRNDAGLPPRVRRSLAGSATPTTTPSRRMPGHASTATVSTSLQRTSAVPGCHPRAVPLPDRLVRGELYRRLEPEKATASGSIESLPLPDQPRALDIAALTACSGGPFHPGWKPRGPCVSPPYIQVSVDFGTAFQTILQSRTMETSSLQPRPWDQMAPCTGADREM